MNVETEYAAADVEFAHQIIGGFVTRCSVMDYRAGQMIARWFSEDDRFKPLSYVMHDLPFRQKRDVVAVRLTQYHPRADELKAVMAEADAIMQRRDLAVHGLLSRGRKGTFSIKSHSAAKFLSDAEDILPLDEVPEWSARAVTAVEEIQRLANYFKRSS